MTDAEHDAWRQSMQNRVILNAETVTNTSASDFPGSHYGRNNAFDLDVFKRRMKIEIKSISPMEMEFDLIGVDASLANAIRRIMLAEVPTVAIDTVFFHTNTSVIPDEVLALRIGHIPVHLDPRLLHDFPSGSHPTDLNTIVFRLNAACTKNSKLKREEAKTAEPKDKYCNSEVTSAMLVWHPEGDQQQMLDAKVVAESDQDSEATRRLKKAFEGYWTKQKEAYTQQCMRQYTCVDQAVPAEAQPVLTTDGCKVLPSYSDIVLCKLRPGQKVHADLHAVKGCGRVHAKWCPVSVASYRLLPDIILREPITGAEAVKFQKCFNAGVIELENTTTLDGRTVKQAKVVRPRLYTMNRECLRHPEFKDKVLLTRIRDHFICKFVAERTGIMEGV